MKSLIFLLFLLLLPFAPCVYALQCGDPESCVALLINIHDETPCAPYGEPGLKGFAERTNIQHFDLTCDLISYDGYIPYDNCYPLSLLRIDYYKLYWNGITWAGLSNLGQHWPSSKQFVPPPNAYVVRIDNPNGVNLGEVFREYFPNGCSDLQSYIPATLNNIGPPLCETKE